MNKIILVHAHKTACPQRLRSWKSFENLVKELALERGHTLIKRRDRDGGPDFVSKNGIYFEAKQKLNTLNKSIVRLWIKTKQFQGFVEDQAYLYTNSRNGVFINHIEVL